MPLHYHSPAHRYLAAVLLQQGYDYGKVASLSLEELQAQAALIASAAGFELWLSNFQSWSHILPVTAEAPAPAGGPTLAERVERCRHAEPVDVPGLQRLFPQMRITPKMPRNGQAAAATSAAAPAAPPTSEGG